MKGCAKIRNLFSSYLCDGVTPDERAAVDEHIGTCERCSSELRSLQKILENVRSDNKLDDVPEVTQKDFASNVYRRIAADTLQRRSRHLFLRRFVLQPSLAAVAAASLIAIGIFRFHPGTVIVDDTPTTATVADEVSTKERRASLYVEEFFRSQDTPYRGNRERVAVQRALATEQPLPDMERFMRDGLLPDSQRMLEEADFINYSLGDRRRALAKYLRVVDYYPDTDAAMKARGRIRAIWASESNIQVEKVDAGI